MEITVRNVNHQFSEIFWKLRNVVEIHPSRNGPVIKFPEPVVTTVKRPTERILFHPGRDANVVFHIMEGIWMLAGREDVAFLDQFNGGLKQFSDNGLYYNAAYGYRMRHHFGVDQLTSVIEVLRAAPETRQAVIQLWDANDLMKNTLDKACNMLIVFAVNDNKLEMTVYNRSNDIVWGYAGANAVHFSMIHEFVASALHMQVGVYRTVSTNLHLYLTMPQYDAKLWLDHPPEVVDYYQERSYEPTPLIKGNEYWQNFLYDCEDFCRNPDIIVGLRTQWFRKVAFPLYMAWDLRKAGDSRWEYWLKQVDAKDIKLAFKEWTDRRVK